MLTGTLDDFTLPDIFKLLSQTKRTGRLEVERSAGKGQVYFRDGEVYFAESTLSKELLGRKLVKTGVLTDTQLMKALDEQADSGGRLGEVLLSGGLVFPEQLQAALQGQLEDAVFDLLRWELGDFTWEPGEVVDPEVEISISVENLIMEASRRLDELEVIRRKIPSEHTVLSMAEAPPEGAVEINITPEEWRVLVLVNGVRSVEEIANAVGLDVFQAMRTLHGLVSAGLVAGAGTDEVEGGDDSDAGEGESQSEFTEGAGETGELFEPEAAIEDHTDAPEEAAPEGSEWAGTNDEPDEVVAEIEGHEGSQNGLVEHDVAVADAESEAEELLQSLTEDGGVEGVAVDEFDAPAEGELVEHGPHELDALEAADSGDQAKGEVSELDIPAEETEIPVSSDPTGDQPTVDKSAAVRELSNLFKQTEVDPSAGGGFVPQGEEPGEEPERQRVEDDEEITRGLISRLIDGVKGL